MKYTGNRFVYAKQTEGAYRLLAVRGGAEPPKRDKQFNK